MTNTETPAGGFSMSGIGVGSVTVQDIDIPATATEKITLQEFSPDQSITLPGAEVSNVGIPAANLDNIEMDGFDFSAMPSRRCLPRLNLGILKLKACVEPVVNMDIGSMTIQDAELSAMTKKLEVDNITIPISIRGIAMRNMALNAIKIT